MSEKQVAPDGQPPRWSACTISGCIGIRISGQDTCLCHADPNTREDYLRSLRSGASVDLRGTVITAELLDAILTAVRTDEGTPVLGDVQFNQARFSRGAWFEEMQFSGDADFSEAQFTLGTIFGRTQFCGSAYFRGTRFSNAAFFDGTQFSKDADFSEARFALNAVFHGTKFSGKARFMEAQFSQVAHFAGARFSGDAEFMETQFSGYTRFDRTEFSEHAFFDRARFSGDIIFDQAQFLKNGSFVGTRISDVSFDGTRIIGYADFDWAQFSEPSTLGPLLASKRLSLDRATFASEMVIEVATPLLSCWATTFDGVTLRPRYAEIVLDATVFAKPSTVAFADDASWFDESPLSAAGYVPRPRLLSLRRVDVANLVLADVDLSACLFGGAHHLDQLRIEGPKLFATTPVGWKWGRVGGQGSPLWRWTKRWTLVEEHLWRTARRLPSGPPTRRHPNGRLHPQLQGWESPTSAMLYRVEWRSRQPVRRTGGPEQIAPLYRALRKAQEDAKDEPGAADLYYGEMEMRRMAPSTPLAERFILWWYWLLAGYSLRGFRALGALLVLIIALAIMFSWFGFASSHPSLWHSLVYTTQATLSLETKAEQLTNQLTVTGEVLRIILRLSGPVLLGLALLSVRNRVKR